MTTWLSPVQANSDDSELFFDISLAEWSLHRFILDGHLTNLDSHPKPAVM